MAVAVETVTSSIRSSFGWMLAKKPSVDRVYLSWMFAPSTVSESALCGSPLTVDDRCEWLAADVSTPGRKTTKLSALRVMSGRFEI